MLRWLVPVQLRSVGFDPVARRGVKTITQITVRSRALHRSDNIQTAGSRNRFMKKHKREKWAWLPSVEKRFDVRDQPVLPPVPKFLSLKDHVDHQAEVYYDPRHEVNAILTRVLAARSSRPLNLSADRHAVPSTTIYGPGVGHKDPYRFNARRGRSVARKRWQHNV